MITQNVSLKKLTSWLIGGEAEYFCQPTTKNEILDALQFAKSKNLEISVLGGGSNVLISDLGIKGLTICLSKFSEVSVKKTQDHLILKCQSGVSKSELLKIFLKHKLAPALFLAGIPGDVGGGVIMNAGVSESVTPKEFTEIVKQISVIDFDRVEETYHHSDLQWSYRKCTGFGEGIITEVIISWPMVVDESILEKVRAANKIRLSKQPLDMPSCGSVFKNPPAQKAAQLIDQCGLKGFTIGEAQVSKKHANFIVNLGQATATDTWNVIEHVKAEVKKKTSVELTTEVRLLGVW